MTLLSFAQWVQSTALSQSLAGSTWAYPVIGALHVLGIAWFAGGVLISALRRDRGVRSAYLWSGVAMMLVTGALLFLIEPQRSARSQAFVVKMLLLIGLAVLSPVRARVPGVLILALWVLVIFASQAIAFF